MLRKAVIAAAGFGTRFIAVEEVPREKISSYGILKRKEVELDIGG